VATSWPTVTADAYGVTEQAAYNGGKQLKHQTRLGRKGDVWSSRHIDHRSLSLTQNDERDKFHCIVFNLKHWPFLGCRGQAASGRSPLTWVLCMACFAVSDQSRNPSALRDVNWRFQ
jgi:hypothetical protein